MGEKILKYFKFVQDEVGLTGKIKLAQLTKMPSTKAAFEPDSVANLQMIKQAVKEITGKTPPEY